MTTNANGLIEIKQKITDVVYLVIEETKAPAGYRLGAEPWKWCYALVPAGDSLSDEDMAKLKESVNCDVPVIPAGSYVEEVITNMPKPGSVQFSGTKAIDGRNMTANDATNEPITASHSGAPLFSTAV